jgi:hypothetical protein
MGMMEVVVDVGPLAGAMAVPPDSMKTMSFVVRIGRPIIIREMPTSAVAVP